MPRGFTSLRNPPGNARAVRTASAPATVKQPDATTLPVAGLVPFSSVDWPGVLCAVLFCQGCPWKCRYCHNAHLRSFAGVEEGASWDWEWEWDRVVTFLKSRQGFLEGVVFSGGEATAHSSLAEAIKEARSLGFRIGLHTSGSYPEKLRTLLPLVDWVGLDIKAPLDERYERITGAEGSERKVRASLELLLASGIPHQLRTTVHPKLLSEEDLADIQEELAAMSAGPSVIQTFRHQGCVDEALLASG